MPGERVKTWARVERGRAEEIHFSEKDNTQGDQIFGQILAQNTADFSVQNQSNFVSKTAKFYVKNRHILRKIAKK